MPKLYRIRREEVFAFECKNGLSAIPLGHWLVVNPADDTIEVLSREEMQAGGYEMGPRASRRSATVAHSASPLSERHRRILCAMHALCLPVRANEIAGYTHLATNAVCAALTSLRRQDYVVATGSLRGGKRVYVLSERGQRFVKTLGSSTPPLTWQEHVKGIGTYHAGVVAKNAKWTETDTARQLNQSPSTISRALRVWEYINPESANYDAEIAQADSLTRAYERIRRLARQKNDELISELLTESKAA